MIVQIKTLGLTSREQLPVPDFPPGLYDVRRLPSRTVIPLNIKHGREMLNIEKYNAVTVSSPFIKRPRTEGVIYARARLVQAIARSGLGALLARKTVAQRALQQIKQVLAALKFSK